MYGLTYGKSWFRARKYLTEPWDQPKARTAHERRKPYVAVIADGESIRCFVEVNNDYMGVGFLDSLLREYLSYQFQELEPGRLFLSMATHREFDGETDRVKSGTTYFFKPDGGVTIKTDDFATAQRTTKKMQADVSGNWETYPAFGEYSSIVRVDR